jgi:hypothetical protein
LAHPAGWPSEQAAAVERFTEELQLFQKERGTADPIPSKPDDTTPAASEKATTSKGVEEESEVADPEPTTPDDDGDEQHDGTDDEDEEPNAPLRVIPRDIAGVAAGVAAGRRRRGHDLLAASRSNGDLPVRRIPFDSRREATPSTSPPP